MQVDIKKTNKNKKALKILADYKGVVKYGIPQETNMNRDKDNERGWGNANILAIMEAGSIPNHIPERKLLGPVREKHKEEIQKYFNQIMTKLLQGDEQGADKIMDRLSLQMQTWTQLYFVDPNNGWAPNAPITIHGGWMRRKGGKAFYIKGKHSDKPLIDTGELRKAIRGLFIKD